MIFNEFFNSSFANFFQYFRSLLLTIQLVSTKYKPFFKATANVKHDFHLKNGFFKRKVKFENKSFPITV